MQPSAQLFSFPGSQDLPALNPNSFGQERRTGSIRSASGQSDLATGLGLSMATGLAAFQGMIDLLPDPTVLVSPSCTIVAANPSAQRVHGLCRSGERGVAWTPPLGLVVPLTEALEGRSGFRATSVEDAACFTCDGEPRYFLPRIGAVRGAGGEIVGAVVVFADVTECRSLDRLKTDMVATVSHELNTPLTSLNLAIELLLERSVGPVTSRQLELLRAASVDVQRLLRTVNELLDLSRIEEGRFHYDRLAVSAGELIEEVKTRFDDKGRSAGVILTTEVDPELPPVLADRGAIGSVLNNLVDNALRHTEPDGRVRLSARRDEPRSSTGRRGHRGGDPGRASAARLHTVLPGSWHTAAGDGWPWPGDRS